MQIVKDTTNNITKCTLIIALLVVALGIIIGIIDSTDIFIIVFDCIIFLILTLLLYDWNYFEKHKFLRFIIFCLLPLIYYPYSWIHSFGLAGVGILYFFIFSGIILHLNANKFGLFTVLLLISEIVLLIYLEQIEILVYNADKIQIATLWLYHFPIVSIAVTLLIFNAICKKEVLNNQLLGVAIKDSLTQAYTRRYLYDFLKRVKGNTTIQKDDFCLAVLDIDKFKYINDTYGHDIGDKVLKLFVDVVIAEIRKCDFVARFGGDEFVLVIKNVPLNCAITRVEKIKETFIDKCRGDLNIDVDVSFGVEYSKHNSIEDLIRKADVKMYGDKNSKKNLIG